MAPISFNAKTMFIVSLTLICAGAYVFANIGNWLLVSDPEPKNIDLIFTFAGGPQRVDHSIVLLKKHPEAKWLASTGSRKLIVEKCKDAGIDTFRVAIVDTCKSTWGEIEVLKAYLKTNKWALSVGLVSNEWHMRRITLTIFRQGLHGVKFACLPVPLELTGPERAMFGTWRKTEKTRAIVESEVLKMGFYFLGLRR